MACLVFTQRRVPESSRDKNFNSHLISMPLVLIVTQKLPKKSAVASMVNKRKKLPNI